MNKNIEEPGYLYKYISFEQFIDLIENKRLYLTRIDQWEDCYEGYYLKKLLDYQLNKLDISSETKMEQMKENINTEFELIKKYIYAQSWSMSKENQESDAMWRIYSPQKTGIRIKVKRENIKKSIYNLILKTPIIHNPHAHAIQYKQPNYEDYNYKDNKAYFKFSSELLYFKRKAFEHEEEYRFSVELQRENLLISTIQKNNLGINPYFRDVVDKINTEKVIYYEVPNSYITEILLDPRAPEYFKETFYSYCKSKDLKNYSKSKLYTLPTIE